MKSSQKIAVERTAGLPRWQMFGPEGLGVSKPCPVRSAMKSMMRMIANIKTCSPCIAQKKHTDATE